eukprot:1483226-Rhodomonas_salina.2
MYRGPHSPPKILRRPGTVSDAHVPYPQTRMLHSRTRMVHSRTALLKSTLVIRHVDVTVETCQRLRSDMYTCAPKSNTRNRIPGPNWTQLAVSCVGLRCQSVGIEVRSLQTRRKSTRRLQGHSADRTLMLTSRLIALTLGIIVLTLGIIVLTRGENRATYAGISEVDGHSVAPKAHAGPSLRSSIR